MTRDVEQPSPGASNRILRWRWYHFYFLLAAVDLVLIAASLALYHQTTSSYELSLQKFGRTHLRQRWVANLRIVVTHLNAPGNDVFESRQVAAERTRFEQQLVRINSLMVQEKELDLNLARFRSHLNEMVAQERRVFEVLGGIELVPADSSGLSVLQAASEAMAAMDRHQANALTALTQIEQEMLMRIDSLLKEYGAFLETRTAVEKYFVAAVIVVLIAMFWYGGKLQNLHERMQEEQQRTLLERTGRLAAMGEVCAAVAHGIRNPLAAISSSAQLAHMQQAGNGPVADRLVDILTECKRLDGRITRLLGFAASATQVREPFDLADALHQALCELGPRFTERRIREECSIEHAPLRVLGDRERLVQALIEILANALEFTPVGGAVWIRLRRSPDRPHHVEATFADSGPGIPESMRSRVFDLFFTTRPEGTGIGLASVKHTVQACDGTVEVTTNAENRSCIRILLPASNP